MNLFCSTHYSKISSYENQIRLLHSNKFSCIFYLKCSLGRYRRYVLVAAKTIYFISQSVLCLTDNMGTFNWLGV